MKRLFFAVLFVSYASHVMAAPKRPPLVPTTPYPVNGATNVAPQITLTCTSVGATTFELYFDAETYRSASGCGFTVNTALGTSHKWHIRAINRYGAVVGPDWQFTTVAPTPPVDPEWTLCAQEGATCSFTGTHAVRYGANGTYTTKIFLDKALCTNDVFGDPAYGVAKHCDVGLLLVTPVPTTSFLVRGPQSDVVCPSNALLVMPGTNTVQGVVAAAAPGATFCLKAGVHTITRAITPKTGQTFVGEYGAILDASAWPTTTDDTQAIFRAHNEDIDRVTIRNLVIRNFRSGKCIHAFKDYSSDWVVVDNEIAGCKDGVSLGPGSIGYQTVVQRNWIHDNFGDITNADAGKRGGGYVFNATFNVGGGFSLLDNEIGPGNGPEQKTIDAHSVIMRGNFIHGNLGGGAWVDGDGLQSVIENNRVEDNAAQGIMWEQARNGVIRNNQIRRNGDQAVFLSTSKDTEVYGNLAEENFRGILAYITCTSVNSQPWGPDLKNLNIHDNTVVVGLQSGAFANGLGYSQCSDAQFASYLNSTSNIRFVNNTYTVPSAGNYWLWNGLKSWAQWQSIAQDVTGSVKVP